MDNIQILDQNIATLTKGRDDIAPLATPYYEKIALGSPLSPREQAYLSEILFLYKQFTDKINAALDLRNRISSKPSLFQRIFTN